VIHRGKCLRSRELVEMFRGAPRNRRLFKVSVRLQLFALGLTLRRGERR
jgi:hypothetical protein